MENRIESMNYSPIIPCRSKGAIVPPSQTLPTPPSLNDIAVECTTRCFQKCKLCYGNFGLDGREMSLEQIKEIKRQFDLANITTAHLTGGEILWHSQIEQIIRLFGQAGYKIEVDTNGVLINKEMAKLLARFGVEVLVGIESLDPEVYQWYRGINSLSAVFNGLDLMLQQGMTPGIQIVAANFKGFSEKYDPVENIFQLIEYSTSKRIPTYLLQYRPFGRAVLFTDLITDLTEEQKTRLRELIANLPPDQRKLVSGDLAYAFPSQADYYGCIGGILLANIDIDGNVFICNWMRDHKFGNIFQEDLQRIITRMREFRFKGLEELSCRLKNCEFNKKGVCFGPCLVSNTYRKMSTLK